MKQPVSDDEYFDRLLNQVINMYKNGTLHVSVFSDVDEVIHKDGTKTYEPGKRTIKFEGYYNGGD